MGLTTEFIEENWPIAKVELGKLFQTSGERVVGLIESDKGKFVYKIADPWKAETAIKRDLSAFDFLNSIGFKHISTILRTKEGKVFAKKDGQFIYLMTFVEGKNPEPTPENYGQLGKITAELHNVKGFPFETEFKAGIVIEDLKKNSKEYSFGKEYTEILNNLPDFECFPKSLIHTDISTGNSMKEENGNIILLDWDDVGIGTRIFDLGQPFGHFVSEDLEFYEERARAFYSAYFKEIELTQAEIDHILDAAIFYACMYLIYGDMEKRWRRIKWSIENRDKLERIIKESI